MLHNNSIQHDGDYWARIHRYIKRKDPKVMEKLKQDLRAMNNLKEKRALVHSVYNRLWLADLSLWMADLSLMTAPTPAHQPEFDDQEWDALVGANGNEIVLDTFAPPVVSAEESKAVAEQPIHTLLTETYGEIVIYPSSLTVDNKKLVLMDEKNYSECARETLKKEFEENKLTAAIRCVLSNRGPYLFIQQLNHGRIFIVDLENMCQMPFSIGDVIGLEYRRGFRFAFLMQNGDIAHFGLHLREQYGYFTGMSSDPTGMSSDPTGMSSDHKYVVMIEEHWEQQLVMSQKRKEQREAGTREMLRALNIPYGVAELILNYGCLFAPRTTPATALPKPSAPSQRRLLR